MQAEAAAPSLALSSSLFCSAFDLLVKHAQIIAEAHQVEEYWRVEAEAAAAAAGSLPLICPLF